MGITVCFKALADFACLTEDDWVVDEHQRLDVSFVRRSFNCFDESALEMALQLSAAVQQTLPLAELTAFTIDDPPGDLFLRHLLAVGYDHAVRIQCPPQTDLRFNPGLVSALIAAYVGKHQQQLVILGAQGAEGDNRQTGFLVAERLGWPCIRDVMKVQPADAPDSLRVTSRIHAATLVQTVALPVVLIVGNTVESPCLRLPTLKRKLAARKQQITVLSSAELDITGDAATYGDKALLELKRLQSSRSCVFLEAGSPGEQARLLYDRYLKERLG